jgi:excisionase family DNA binding protein
MTRPKASLPPSNASGVVLVRHLTTGFFACHRQPPVQIDHWLAYRHIWNSGRGRPLYHATPERCGRSCYSACQDEIGQEDRETGPMTGRSVTTKEAAEALGISVEAVRKRIERGQLGHERVDGRVYVYLDDDQTKSGLDVEVESTLLISELRARIELLEDQLEQANERERQATERDRENRRLLAAALERIPPQLEAPRDEQESPVTTTEEEAEPRPSTGGSQEAAERRSWWRRMFGG